MSRWTFREDRFIHAFFEAVGDGIGPRDLNRPEGAVARRVRHLKKTGAWEALNDLERAESSYRERLGLPVFGEDAP